MSLWSLEMWGVGQSKSSKSERASFTLQKFKVVPSRFSEQRGAYNLEQSRHKGSAFKNVLLSGEEPGNVVN